MEGVMYESAASSSKQVRQEEMREAMVDEAAAIHGMPHQYMTAATFPQGQGVPQEPLNTAQAYHQAWTAQASGALVQQQAQILQINLARNRQPRCTPHSPHPRICHNQDHTVVLVL